MLQSWMAFDWLAIQELRTSRLFIWLVFSLKFEYSWVYSTSFHPDERKKNEPKRLKNSFFHDKLDYCWFSREVIKNCTLENFQCSWVFSFMKYIRAAENEYSNKFLLRKSSSLFCDRSELEFLSFLLDAAFLAAERCQEQEGWKSDLYWGGGGWGFCYVNSCHILEKMLLYINVYEFLERRIHAFLAKLSDRCFCYTFRSPCWCSNTKLYKFDHEYSRSSPCDHSRKRPALVTTTFVKPCLNCDLNFVMKTSRKRPRPLLGLPNWTFPLFLNCRKQPLRVLL